MLIPKETTKTIYEYLYKEGTLVAKKDTHAPKHPQINASNLQVMKTMASLKSRGFVREMFAWRHYYWVLTNEGIQYLRDYLHLPPEIVPNTLLKKTVENRPQRARAPTGGARGPAPDSSRHYRRAEGASFGGDKKADAGAGSSETFQFRGGYGRGRARGGDGGSSESRWRRDTETSHH